jgi:CrcB protein
MIRNILLIGLGGAFGSMIRYLIGWWIGPKSFPLSTFLINIGGSFLIGLVMAYCLKNESFSTNWKLFLTVGICGGFTTFSTFSLENLQLIQNGKFAIAACYTVASFLLGILAVWTGFKLING